MYNVNLGEGEKIDMADSNVWQDAWGSMSNTFKSGLANVQANFNKGVSSWGQQAIADFFHTPSGDKIKHDATAKSIGEMLMDNWKYIAGAIVVIILLVVLIKRKR